MAVQVDEAGRHDEPGGVDPASRRGFGVGGGGVGGRGVGAQDLERPVPDRDRAREPRRPRPVDDDSALDEHVHELGHRPNRQSPRSPCAPRSNRRTGSAVGGALARTAHGNRAPTPDPVPDVHRRGGMLRLRA